MILLMRFYGLRVSDVATLHKEPIEKDHIFLHALKNGAPIWLPLYPEVTNALDRVRMPMSATRCNRSSLPRQVMAQLSAHQQRHAN
jgi:hypothetical protein